MKTFRHIFLFLPVLVLCACSSTHTLQLNTIRPASVTYHSKNPQVTVVNNCKTPDGSRQSRYIDENGKHYRLTFNTDSVPSYFAMATATGLYESRFFSSVEVLFPDSNDISGNAGICDSTRHEWELYHPDMAHIVINELQPRAVMQVKAFDGIFGIELSITTLARIQCLIPGGTPATFAIADTLQWHAYGDTPEMARGELPLFDLCLEEALSSLAYKSVNCFTPHERVVNRHIFVTGHAAMSDAYRYWSNKQYTEASYIWEYVFENATNKGRRAKAAANLALYYELEDNYTEALKYARQAQSLFLEEREVAEIEYMNHYCKDLEKRIAEDHILDTVYQ